MTARTSDLFDLRPTATACAIVPLYHAHGSWGLPFASAMTGCALVLPGLQLDDAALAETLHSFGVRLANGVPTIWQGLVSHIASVGQPFSTLKGGGLRGSA